MLCAIRLQCVQTFGSRSRIQCYDMIKNCPKYSVAGLSPGIPQRKNKRTRQKYLRQRKLVCLLYYEFVFNKKLKTRLRRRDANRPGARKRYTI